MDYANPFGVLTTGSKYRFFIYKCQNPKKMETNPTVSIELPNLRINLSQGMLNFIEFFDEHDPGEVARSLENVFDLTFELNRDISPYELHDLHIVKKVFKLLPSI